MKKINMLVVLSLLASTMLLCDGIAIKDEQHAFNIIQQYLPKNAVVIEAGAYDGKDTLAMSQRWPHVTFHSFEPDPQLFAKLKNTVGQIPNVRIYELALSSHNGTATFHTSEYSHVPGVSTASGSLLAPHEHSTYAPEILFNRQVTVKTITLDDWAQQNTIDHVDALWLDMQGVELNVMKASPKIMSTVKIVYTEVEYVEAYKGQALYKEVREWLEQQGFTFVGERNNGWHSDILMIRK